jgi:predicted nucleic acid-binding protein
VIGTPDLLIGGIALYKDIELITNNEKHYKHIELGA